MAMLKRSKAIGAAIPAWRFPTRERIREGAAAVPRQNREAFYRSIRFRLTAWYATVLVVVIVTTGIAVSASVNEALEQETDDRLFEAASGILDLTTVTPRVPGEASGDQTTPEDADPPAVTYEVDWPDISNYLLSGLWVQPINQGGIFPVIQELGSAQDLAFPSNLFLSTDYEAALNEGETIVQTVRSDDLIGRAVIVPLITGEGEERQTVGAIAVGVSLETRESTLDVVNQILQLSGVFGVIVAAWAGWIVAGRALSSVKRITRVAENIAGQPNSAESLATRIDVPRTGDEISHLAGTFNTMLARIEDAFNVQRRFVADASHELRTPLTAIRGNVDVLLRQSQSGRAIPNEVLAESLDDVHRESARMARLIEDLLTLARSDTQGESQSIQKEEVSLDELAREAFATLEPIAGGRNLVLGDLEPVELQADGDRLIQVMIILGENALRHTPDEGTVELSVDQGFDIESGEAVARIMVRDTGEGIPAEHLPHLFERFYRAEGSRERRSGGTGLGLPIALGIVRGHDGWIDVETAPDRGSTFTVSIPIGS
jgi:signal transduction histidine kinase